MARKILLVENDPSVRTSLREFLKVKGYEVYTASDPLQAKKLLQEKWVHLAILDIRLIDDNDPNDISGLTLASECDPRIVKIILTGYPSFETLKIAKETNLNGAISAFDYAEKQEGPDKLLERIKLIFKNRIKINFDLPIDFAKKLTLEEIVDSVKFKGEKEALRDEIIEIFQRLFWDANKITIFPLAEGFSGAGVVKVAPEYDGGLGNEVVVKFGQRKYIEIENGNFSEYVKRFIGGMRSTIVMNFACTLRLAGIVYSLVGNTFNKVYSFEEYYNLKSIDKIEGVIIKLFQETCRPWYNQKTRPTLKDLAKEYIKELPLDQKKLNQAYESNFKRFYQDGLIQFNGIKSYFINPVSWIANKEFCLPISFCVTHGDLNKNNIILDDNGNTWLIDFFRTKKSYVLRDFIRLETTIKFELLDIKNVKSLYEFESALLAYDRFPEFLAADPTFSGDEAKLNKAFRIIKKIRELAYLTLGGESEMREYYVGLLFQTLRFLDWESVNNKDYILISASMICRKLT